VIQHSNQQQAQLNEISAKFQEQSQLLEQLQSEKDGQKLQLDEMRERATQRKAHVDKLNK